MPHIAKLFVQDEDGNVVGTFVVDLQSIIDLHQRRLACPQGEEVQEIENPPKIGLVRRVSKRLGVYRDANGKERVDLIPLDDQ